MASAPRSCWAIQYQARLTAARRFLERFGTAPEAVNRDEKVIRWRVPGWTRTFGDAEIIALAQERGFDG